jgi:hypothetical protein
MRICNLLPTHLTSLRDFDCGLTSPIDCNMLPKAVKGRIGSTSPGLASSSKGIYSTASSTRRTVAKFVAPSTNPITFPSGGIRVFGLDAVVIFVVDLHQRNAERGQRLFHFSFFAVVVYSHPSCSGHDLQDLHIFQRCTPSSKMRRAHIP